MKKRHAWHPVAAAALLSVWAVLLAACPAAADDADDIINGIVRETRTRTEAAKKLLTTAESLSDAPQVQVRLCEKAHEYGLTSQAGYPTALAALDMLEKIAPRQLSTWRAKRLEVYNRQYYRGDKDSRFANGKAFIKALLAAADQCGKENDWATAAKHRRRAYGVARTLDLPNKKAVYESARAADNMLRVHALIKGLKGVLARNPADAAARSKLVRMYLVDLDMPAEAVKYLGDGLDATLARNVSMATKEASELADEDFATLGKWFGSLAAKASAKDAKINMLTRGRDYMRMYLEVYTKQDVTRLAALRTLKALEDKLKALAISDKPPEPKWIDMLALIDPKRHTVTGTWSRQGSGLVGSHGGHALVTAPVVAFGSYDLQLVFTVLSGTESAVILPAGSGHVTMTFGGWGGAVSGLSSIDGEHAADSDNPTGINLGKGAKTFRLGVKATLDVAVRIKDDQAHITATLDGKKAIDWTGKQSALTEVRNFVLPVKTFGLGTCASKVLWHTAKVRLLDPADRNIKWVSKDATFRLSSSSVRYPPLKAFLTGVGNLNAGCAIYTNYEYRPYVIVTLKKPVDVKRILITNRHGSYGTSTTGLRVWTSSDGATWQELWQAAKTRSTWIINLKTPVKARYVKIGQVSDRRTYLALAGVRIYAATQGRE